MKKKIELLDILNHYFLILSGFHIKQVHMLQIYVIIDKIYKVFITYK